MQSDTNSEARAAKLYRQADELIERAKGTPGTVDRFELYRAADAAMTAARCELAGPQVDRITGVIVEIAENVAAIKRRVG